MTKTKYRIVQTYMSDHSIYYRVDKRLLFFFWDEGRYFDSFQKARAEIAKLRLSDNRPKDVVLQED